MNFQYLDDLDFGFIYSIFYLKETVLSLNENSTEKSSSNEEKEKETETSSKRLTLKDLSRQLNMLS